MTIWKRNKEKSALFTAEDEQLLFQVEKALKDEAVDTFETKLAVAFPRKIGIEQNLIRIAAVFVTVVALSAGIHFITNPLHKKLYGRYYKHFPADNTSGIARGDYNLKTEALQMYSDEKYSQVIPKFYLILRQEPDDVETKFLLAISLIETGKTSEPRELLRQLIEAHENFYTDDALWYEALLYLKLPDYKMSRELLQKIGNFSEYYAPAQELFKKIEKK
jgi:hypothetical protein